MENQVRTVTFMGDQRGLCEDLYRCKETGRVYITSQNHGYAIVGSSIDPAVGREQYVNVNDGTCEGVRYLSLPAFTTQFHPEACGGPLDTEGLFDRFFAMMGA